MMRATIAAASGLLTLLLCSTAQAKPAHKKAFAEFFGPTLAKSLHDCRTCHVPEKPGEENTSERAHNVFGARLAGVRDSLKAAGKKLDIAARLLAIANEDSDGDGVPNLIELLSGHQPGDRADQPSPAEIVEVEKRLPSFLATRTTTPWSPFETVQRPAVPTVKNTSWVRNAVDAFIALEHEKEGLKPRPETARHVLLRRVYLDLIGLPPTPEELHAFLADDSPDAYEKVVRRLLDSPRYGERWGRHWMDVWRYSDWSGYGEEVRDSQRHIWHWRDWIIESLNADKGYDRMILEMLAGDEIAPTDPDTLRATGFLVRNWYKFNRQIWLDNTVEHTAKAFLGVTMNCAKCHDHFFDAISQKEYYQFRAFFETHDVRTDRLPGEADVNKAGLPRVYDAHLTTPTYLFVRGEEHKPDKRKSLGPAVPLLLGGPAVAIQPIVLPKLASMPDVRDFVVRETIAASHRAIDAARKKGEIAQAKLAKAETHRGNAAEAEILAWKSLTALRFEILYGYGGKIYSLRFPDLKQSHASAIAKADDLAKADAAVRVARSDADETHGSTCIAELSHDALLATMHIEELEARGAKVTDPETWRNAALAASEAQRKLTGAQLRREQAASLKAIVAAEQAVEVATAAVAAKKDDKKLLDTATGAKKNLEAARAASEKVEERYRKFVDEIQRPVTTEYKKRELKTYPATTTGRRLALARWIADRQNPLTARVAVNHVWLRHFGKPLVPSVFDLGRNGQPPTHPALLDWLAAEFVEQRWSMKELHRLLVTSSTYRMDTAGDEVSAKLDPDNRYLWRMNSRRLEAEAVRDGILHVAGTLDLSMGGPDLDQKLGETTERRSLYYRHAHEKYMPFLKLFDGALVTECYQRAESVVPQQALALANSTIVLSQARQLARLLKEDDQVVFVRRAFGRVLGRPSTAAEETACLQFLNDQARRLSDPKTLTALTGPASRVAPAADPHDRAREGLVQVLLNHHEFVTIR